MVGSPSKSVGTPSGNELSLRRKHFVVKMSFCRSCTKDREISGIGRLKSLVSRIKTAGRSSESHAIQVILAADLKDIVPQKRQHRGTET
jgi:hypothetical protein